MKTDQTEPETKHAPGPWYPATQNDMLYITAGRAPSGGHDHPYHGANRTVIAKVYHDVLEEGIANSNLLAAAPDLLAALEASVATMSKVQVGIAVGLGKYSPDIVAALAQARAAIARAKGAK